MRGLGIAELRDDPAKGVGRSVACIRKLSRISKEFLDLLRDFEREPQTAGEHVAHRVRGPGVGISEVFVRAIDLIRIRGRRLDRVTLKVEVFE